MLFFTRKPALSYVAEEYCKEVTEQENPGRGWYRIYTYFLGEGNDSPELPVKYGRESLALVRINIGQYQKTALDAAALQQLEKIFEGFQAAGLEMILRICYDVDGKGMEREPSLFSLVKEHLDQLIPVLNRHAGQIFIFQGLLVGNWGEMHGSKFLTKKHLQEMATLFYRGTGGGISLAVRKPVQYRMIVSAGEEELSRTGFFDDAVFGSDTHLGTFGEEYADSVNWEEMWNPGAEKAFMKKIASRIPFGGEVLHPQYEMTAEEMLNELRELNVSYLNTMHEYALLEEWKKISYGKTSLYDYIGQHLGYCLLVTGSFLRKKQKRNELVITIQNQGFASVYEEMDAAIYVQEEEMKRWLPLSGQLKGMGPQEKRELTAVLPEQATVGEPPFEKTLVLILQRKKDGKEVFPAQKRVGDHLILGTLRLK